MSVYHAGGGLASVLRNNTQYLVLVTIGRYKLRHDTDVAVVVGEGEGDAVAVALGVMVGEVVVGIAVGVAVRVDAGVAV